MAQHPIHLVDDSTKATLPTHTESVESHLSLDDPSLYLNRELSFLAFNQRVLDFAADPNVPLLERLRFIGILSSNLDEFFEVRVAGLKKRVGLDLASPYPDGGSAEEVLRLISSTAHTLVKRQYDVAQTEIFPALEAEGIRVLQRGQLSDAQKEWAQSYFKKFILPVLTPVGLDPSHPFPNLQNKSLNFAIRVSGEDAFGRNTGVVIMQVPRSLPRMVHFPQKVADGDHEFIMISSIIHANVNTIFPGMKATGCYQFRVTRNSDMYVDEDEVDDLLTAIKGELHGRHYGFAIRLEVPDNCKPKMTEFLLQRHGLGDDDLYRVAGPVDWLRFGDLYDLVDRPDLKFPPFSPGSPVTFGPKTNPFAQLQQDDILLHHPYQSYSPVVDLLYRAADDPNVLAIKQTLYRTGEDSPVVDALIQASLQGKDVTVVIELRARFDEGANIALAKRLQTAGAKVVYGIVGFKCHAKMLMIVRREQKRLKRYVHLGTGNYHSSNARFYTDFGLLTANPKIGEDVHKVFLGLTSLGQAFELKCLLQSPFTLHQGLLHCIAEEIEAAKAGQPAFIWAKMNSLSEPQIIQALYRASQAGVQIRLLVRGICCLRPGLPGISENIEVHSIVGRFLEHSRVYYFHAQGEDRVYLSSADWMHRNLLRRVEVCVPIQDHDLKARLIHETFDLPLPDSPCWQLRSDGTYVMNPNQGEDAVHSQDALLKHLSIQI